MSAASSPGRTWPGFIAERRVPVLAGALAAAVLHGGRFGALLSGLGGAPSTALFAYVGNQNDSRRQLDREHPGHWDLDFAMVALSVEE